MIIGTGIDIVEIKRFQKLNNKNDFVRQFLTEKEITTVSGKYLKDEFYAMFFATKEAILKALGCGLEYGSYWHNIEINKQGKAVLSGFVKKFAKEKSAADIHVSYAHSKEYAMAVAVAEGKVDQKIRISVGRSSGNQSIRNRKEKTEIFTVAVVDGKVDPCLRQAGRRAEYQLEGYQIGKIKNQILNIKNTDKNKNIATKTRKHKEDTKTENGKSNHRVHREQKIIEF